MPVEEGLPTIRLAAHGDRDAISAGDYSEAQIEAALRAAWGVDTRLIDEGTMFVAVMGTTIVACGAWSSRRVLFGTTEWPGRDEQALDPRRDAARIRAFFVDPDYARRGIASLLLDRCENEAMKFGFLEVESGATKPGQRFYAARNPELHRIDDFECAPGIELPVAVMKKPLIDETS